MARCSVVQAHARLQPGGLVRALTRRKAPSGPLPKRHPRQGWAPFCPQGTANGQEELLVSQLRRRWGAAVVRRATSPRLSWC